MKIIGCDDDKRQLVRLEELLREYREPSGEQLFVRLFSSASELLDELSHNKYDLVILDIIMPGLTGMEAAKEIRKFDKDIRIAFLTSSKEFAVESYHVRAYDYIMKPVSREPLFALLNRVLNDFPVLEELFHINTLRSVLSVPFSSITYVEINNRTLTFNLADNSSEQITGKLADYEDTILSRCEFIKPHRSFLVNMLHIKTIDVKEIVMRSGKVIPVSRSSSREIKDRYMDFMFS